MQDVLRGWSRRGGKSPDLGSVVAKIAKLAYSYGTRTVVGDRYGAAWVRQAFEEEKITYRESEYDKSTAYIETLPLFSQGRIHILDHPRLVRELQCLERRTRAGGKDVVDHPRGGHDDFANVLAVAAADAVSRRVIPAAAAIGILKSDPWPLGFLSSRRWP